MARITGVMVHAPQTSAMNRLIAKLSRLPGIGNRSAQRLAFYLLKQPAAESYDLAAAITDLKRNTRHCSTCFNLTESDPCPICTDSKRDRGVILIVEQPSDVATFESTGSFKGLYHVLMGRLSPLEGLDAGELNIDDLFQRIRKSNASGHPDDQTLKRTTKKNSPEASMPSAHSAAESKGIREVILGLSPTLEGDGTALFLSQRLTEAGISVSRLARGLPTGSSLELVSKAVLSDSIHGRRPMTFD